MIKETNTLLKHHQFSHKNSKCKKITKLLKNNNIVITFILTLIFIFLILITFFLNHSPYKKNLNIKYALNETANGLNQENKTTRNITINYFNVSNRLNNNINKSLNDCLNNRNKNNSKNKNDNTESYKNSIYVDGKLYWKDTLPINIVKIKEEIRSYNNLTISFENKSDFIKRENPKISVIITVHDQEENIKKIYSSIQRQELKDIEIIFVDDASQDNTSKIINELMLYDKRIVYLKNEINKQAFYSRNKGILNSKGEYILIIDPDDLLLNNILIKAYETAKKFDLDIIQFYIMMGNNRIQRLWKDLRYREGILKNNDEIKDNFYHSVSRNLWDKLVRREIYLKSIEFMKEEYRNELYFLNNDDTAFFGLVHVANTFGFLEAVGYYYIVKPKGTLYYRNDPKNTNLIFRSVFNNMKYFYMQSDNTIADKINLAYKYFDKSFKRLKKGMNELTTDFDFILSVLDLYLNSNFFHEIQKQKLNIIKTMVIERKNDIKIK